MTVPVSYQRHRFPSQIIAHAVWLDFRFPLSLRRVEEMLLELGPEIWTGVSPPLQAQGSKPPRHLASR